MQGMCTSLGGLCILDAKQNGRLLYGTGPWMKLTLNNVSGQLGGGGGERRGAKLRRARGKEPAGRGA